MEALTGHLELTARQYSDALDAAATATSPHG